MTSRTRLILIVWTLAIIVLVGVASWLFFVRGLSFDILMPEETASPDKDLETRSSEVLYGSTVYEEIRAYKALGETEKVKGLFEELQRTYATGTPERSVVDYDFGFYLMFSTGERAEGIAMLQALATDEAEEPLTRAFAFEALGRATLVFGSSPTVELIFVTEPFSTIRSEAGTNYLAAIGLFKAALEMHPTAIAALRVAQLQSYRLQNQAATLTEEEKQAAREDYQKHMAIADAEALYIEGKVAFNQYLADFFITKAYTLGVMFFAGEPVDPEEVRNLYRKSIALAEGSEQVFARFNYAAFLSRAEAGTPAEVDALIVQIEQMPVHTRRLFNQYIVSALTNKTGAYTDVVRLMEYSAVFKSYVEQLQNANAAS